MHRETPSLALSHSSKPLTAAFLLHKCEVTYEMVPSAVEEILHCSLELLLIKLLKFR